MQDVFIEAYRNFHKLRNLERIGAWLYKATIYRCKDHARKAIRREKREQRFTETSPANPLTNMTPVAGTTNGVVEAIELLPEKYRRILMLKHFAGLSYAEISALTGLSNTTICGRLQAARKNLREKLAEIGQGVDRK
jgi:RNA polymerase sigma-70 factor (ECF subfamily)